MRNLIFRNIWLWSGKERKARRENLHEKTVIIRGANSTGKSSFIKSLYYTLGADVSFHAEWSAAHAASVVEVSLEKETYFFLRQHDLLAVFDSNKKILFASSSIREASKFLGGLFDFSLPLAQRSDGLPILAYPAFQYLPYYLDQDKSWSKAWTAFEGLSQFKAWQRELIDYHTGIRPARWYQINEKLAEISVKLSSKEGERRHIFNAQKHIEGKEPTILLDINVDTFKVEIDQLLKECEKLKIKQEDYRTRLFRLRSREAEIKLQIEIAKASLTASEKDSSFVSHELVDPHIDCPMCGTQFENSMINRFSLVEDAQACRSLLIQLDVELRAVVKEIEPVERDHQSMSEQIDKISELLNQKRGELRFADVIKAESQKQVRSVLQGSLDDYTNEIDSLLAQDKDLKAEKRKLTDPAQTKTIKDYYNNLMRRYLFELSVMKLSPEQYEGLPTGVVEKGSEQPRALLAYHYAVLHTIKKFGKGVFFPVVLDSPNQQDQDNDNLKKLMEFSFKERIDDSQVILGTVEMHGAEHDGQDIQFTKPYQMLSADQFEDVDQFVHPLLDAALIYLSREQN